MTALTHLKRYPSARPATIIRKARQDALHAAMRREVEARKPVLSRVWAALHAAMGRR